MAIKLSPETKRPRGRPSNASRAAAAEQQDKQATRNAALAGAGMQPLSNVTDETILEYIDGCEPYYQEMESARERFRQTQERYRAYLKRAAQNNVIELDWLMKTRRKDIGEVDRQIAARNRLAKLGRLPLGTQLGFLTGQTTVASAVDEAQIQERRAGPEPKPEPEEPTPPPPPAPEPAPVLETAVTGTPSTGQEFRTGDEAKAYNQGGRAFMFGRSLDANIHPAGTDLARQWARGWMDKQAGA